MCCALRLFVLLLGLVVWYFNSVVICCQLFFVGFCFIICTVLSLVCLCCVVVFTWFDGALLGCVIVVYFGCYLLVVC